MRRRSASRPADASTHSQTATVGGWALIHTVLATLRGRYIDGLTACRYTGSPSSAKAASAVAAWLDVFLHATTVAAGRTRLFADQVTELQSDWEAKPAEYGAAQAQRGRGRRGTRQLASTCWDARVSTPNRPVPALPRP